MSRTRRGRGARPDAGPAQPAALLAGIAQAADVQALHALVREHAGTFKPGGGASGSKGGAERVALFVELLKKAFALFPETTSDSTALQESIRLVEVGLSGLQEMRAHLKGRHYEIEVHMYRLAQKLTALQQHVSALGICWGLYDSIGSNWPTTLRKGNFPQPQGTREDPQAVSLVSGTVLLLAVCTSSRRSVCPTLTEVLRLSEATMSTEAWIRYAAAYLTSTSSAAWIWTVHKASTGMQAPVAASLCCPSVRALPAPVSRKHPGSAMPIGACFGHIVHDTGVPGQSVRTAYVCI